MKTQQQIEFLELVKIGLEREAASAAHSRHDYSYNRIKAMETYARALHVCSYLTYFVVQGAFGYRVDRFPKRTPLSLVLDFIAYEFYGSQFDWIIEALKDYKK